MPSHTDVTILLVEDDLGHARLILKNLLRSGIANEVVHVTDGQQAIDYLFGTGEYEDSKHPLPVLVLLDLDLPLLDGYQVLERIKSDRRAKRIPIIILTTTDDRREVGRCYELGCNAYLTKPVDYTSFSEVIRKVGLFLSIVTIPHGE
jgi:CheY-like chemotaxis protein